MKETKFKQTEVGMIPSDWDVCEIGSVCSIFGRIGFRGYTVLDLVDEGCGAITLSPSNIKNNRMDYSKYTEISWKKYEESPEIKIFNGDILLVKTGSTFGKSALVENLPHEATINPQFVVLKKIQISNAYLNYVIADTVVQKQIQETIVGGAIPTLSQKQIAGFNIPLPSSTEQQRIANVLSDVDTLIANLEKLIAKKKNIKQGAMQELLTGKKRLPGFAPAKPTYKQTELGKIPTDWEIIFIKRNYFLKGRIGWQGLKASEFKTEGPYLVTGTDFVNGRVNWETCYHITEKRYEEDPALHVQLNDLLITKDGTVGKVAYIDKKPEKVSLNSHLLIIRPLRDFLNNKYLYYVLNSPFFETYFNQVQTGTTMASLSQAKISEFSYPLPSFNEQTAIANILSDMDAEIATLETKLAKYRKLKTGMMQQLLTGKVRLV